LCISPKPVAAKLKSLKIRRFSIFDRGLETNGYIGPPAVRFPVGLTEAAVPHALHAGETRPSQPLKAYENTASYQWIGRREKIRLLS
jgi:hypothetical protein